MGKNVNKKFTVGLEISTEEAEKQVKASAENIKQILSNAIKDGISVKELRNMANTINSMFEGIGHAAPINIDENFTGRGKTAERVKILTDALDNLAIAMDKIKTDGFGGENFDGISKEVQAEIDRLKKQRQELQEVVDTINSPENIAIKLSEKSGEQLKQLKEIKEAYLEARDAKQQLENSNMTNTPEYLEAVGKYVKAASMFTKAFQSENLTDKGIDFASTRENLNLLAESEAFIKNFHKNFASQAEQIKKVYSDLISDIDKKIGKINPQDKTIEENAYDNLKKKLQEYYDLKQKLQSAEKDSAEWNNINDRQRAIQDEIYAMKELSEEQENAFYDLFDNVDDNKNLQLNDVISQFCNILQIDIPNGAEQAASAAMSAFAKITKGAEQAGEASQKVMYHLGNLLNGKGQSRDTFGDMAENLTTNVAGTKWEKYGFGVLGGGLFGVIDPSTISQEPGKSNFIQSIDISKYNMYMADTEERATALIDFLSKLQKFSMKSAEPNYTGFDAYLQGTDIDSLYDQFKVVFEQSDLTKERFQEFVNGMVNLLKQAGLAFDAQTGELNFTNMSKELAGSENISTRFMKMLGFEGVNTGTTSFGGFGQVSVLFDFEKVDIVGYFESVKSAIQDYEKIIQQASNGTEWVGTTDQLQQYANNIDAIIDKLQNYKNSGILKDTSELDETLSKLTQIRENITNILSGKDISGNSPFETITTGVKSVDNSVDQAATKVQEFLALTDEIHNKSFSDNWDATDNVEIGKYTERLNSAKAALDELGNQGQLTAEQLEQVNNAFDTATRDLNAKTHTYDAYASGYSSTYDYYDEYHDEIAKNEKLQTENEQLRAQLTDQESGRQQAQAENTSQELNQLNDLHAKLIAVKEAVEAKTQAFEEEYVTVDAAVNAEIESLQLLLKQLQDVLSTLNSVNLAFTQANESIAQLYGTKDINIKEDATANAALEKSKEIINKQYALDTTVASTNKILGDILAAINKEKDPGVQKELGTLISALTANINTLKDATNGIIDHQKAQKTDTTKAMARIQDTEQRQIVSGIAKDSVEDLGTEAEIESLQALANGLVKVEGAFKNANGQWEGFTVKVNEHNKAVDLAIKKHSAFANMLNNPKKANGDDNPYQYSKAEVEARAQAHLDELIAQGKNATVQFKDSGRYTITILEEIDGLSKQIFQTFDENDKKIERTTVTMSNSQKEKLDRLQKQLIDNGVTNGLISDKDQTYNDYQKASDALDNMTSAYSQMDSLSNEQIAKWKQQIALVQQLGGQVEALIKQRKLANDTKIFESDRTKKLSKFDLDKAELQKNIAIPDSFNQRITDARSAISNAVDSDALKIAINNWEALKNEIKATATQQDLYIKKTKETKKAAPKQDAFTGRLATQKKDFAQYKQDVENAVGVTDELRIKLNDLETQLNSVGDADGLAKWVQSFKNVANEIKSSRGKIATEITGKVNSKFREVDFKADSNNLTDEQQAIVDKRKKLLQQIDEYNAKVSSSQKAEISGIEVTRDTLYQLIDAYKKKHNIENAGGSATKKAYGTAQLQNFTGKYNSLMNRAGSVELNSDFEAVQKLADAYKKLQEVQAKFKIGEDTKSGVGAQKAEEFKQAQIECNRYAQELAKIIAAEEKLRTDSASSDGKSAPVAEDFENSIKGRAQALEDFVRTQYGASASTGKFNDDMTELSFVVKNGDGTITNMTASLNAARTAIYATAGGAEKATSSFGKFFAELKGKARGIATYLISMTGFQEIWQQIRQGIQYVRDIDSALTELKKVTDETDTTYNTFLQTMSKTADVVGSTVSDLTTMAAEWARLNI